MNNTQTSTPDTPTTTGLIIAAGAGTRLADDRYDDPKPLRKVCGIPLLRRTILSASKAGLTKIYIVVGFQKEKIKAYVKKRKWPVEVVFIENDDWKKSNGISVLKAKEHINENFVLMMSDHIFDYNSLKDFLHEGLGAFHAKLAVDYKIHQIFDKDDATKVVVKNSKIIEIEKNLVEYNAVDTGLFLLSPVIFDALEEAMHDGDCSLSDGIRSLSGKGKMGVFDIKEGFWQDVDTPASLKHAKFMLLNSCRKTTDGIVSRNFNRHISLAISRHLVKTSLTANQFTFIVLFLGLAAGHMASLGTYTSFLIGAVLFKLTSILDGVDGEISKLKMTSSKFGQWLDTICDNITYVVFFAGTVVGLYRQECIYRHALTATMVIGVVFAFAVIFWYLLKFSKSGSLIAVQQDFKTREDLNWFSKLFIKAQFAIKRDFFAAFFLVLAIIDKPQWVLFVIALALNITWITIVQQQVFSSRRNNEIS